MLKRTNHLSNFQDPRILFAGFIMVSPAMAEVTVNPAIPLTHRVQIQPIRVHTTTGEVAPTFGSASTETYIKNQINRIWAQAGVRIDWLPVNEYTDDFTYDGWPANYSTNARPEDDLGTLVDDAPVPPKSSNGIVINLFFCGIVPGFPQTTNNTSNGLAFVDSNGISAWVGPELLTFTAGMDVVASVLAHEIGHNLGLNHTANNGDNLMSPGGTSDRLTSTQRTTVFTNNSGTDGFDFLQALAAPDNYSQWAAARSVTGTPAGDDDHDGVANVIEFMLGLNPKVSSTLPAAVAGTNGLTWTLTKQAPALADGLIYQVKSSSNLVSWLNAGSAGSGSTVLQDSSSSLVVRLNPGAPARFMRLEVAIPAGLGAGATVTTFVPADAPTAPRVYPNGGGHAVELLR